MKFCASIFSSLPLTPSSQFSRPWFFDPFYFLACAAARASAAFFSSAGRGEGRGVSLGVCDGKGGWLEGGRVRGREGKEERAREGREGAYPSSASPSIELASYPSRLAFVISTCRFPLSVFQDMNH